jgi:predicted helicase
VNTEPNASFSVLLASLSSDALTRGKQFERLVKWWLTQDPIWSRKIKNVWLWDEWPEYPGRDIGIDLVAEMTDGTLCAVQAKCFDENRDVLNQSSFCGEVRYPLLVDHPNLRLLTTVTA